MSEQRERGREAYRLRAAGATWKAIAKELGYHDYNNARRAAQEAASREEWSWPLAAPAQQRGSSLDAITGEQWASMTNTAIGELAGVSRQAAGRYRKRHDLPAPDKRQKSAKTWQEGGTHRMSVLASVRDEQWREATNWQIADEFGVSHQAVAQYRKRHGKPVSPVTPGQTQRHRNETA